jgi:hypothetical protein
MFGHRYLPSSSVQREFKAQCFVLRLFRDNVISCSMKGFLHRSQASTALALVGLILFVF